MEAAYATNYTRLYREHWWWRVRERILLDKVRQLLPGRLPRPRILDIGCGAGVFFDALEPIGDLEGIESDPSAVEQSGRWRSRIHIGELDDAFTPDQAFDLILLLDVLEHVARPEDVLRRATKILAPGGWLLATVPAFDWLWTSHDELNHHVKRYSAGELRNLVSDAGLKVVETSYLFQSLLLPKLIMRAKEALTPSQREIPSIPSPAVNHMLQAWYRSEYAIAGWLPFGSSVMAIGQRMY